MAAIRETLILEDKFTSTMTQCLQVAQRMANMLDDVRASTMNVETAAAATAVQMQELAGKMTQTNSRGTSLLGTIRNLAGTFLGMQSVRWLVNTSDQLTSINARLRLMTGSAEAAAAAQEEIYQAAMRSRGAYADMADFVSQLGTVAGNAFTGTDELVAFAEQIQKQMAISGASGASAQAALVQLTQGLASGTLRGEELNSVLEQTPMIAQTIAEYMGVTTGEMRELASEGKVTAEVVKNAMLGAAEETNAQFEQMPMTWAQVWTMFQNVAIQALDPVLDAISWLANHLEELAPILAGLAAGAVAFAAGLGIQAAATWIANGAAKAFFTTLLTNPLTYIVLIIGLVVAAIYQWVQSMGGLEIAWLTVVDSVLYAWDTVKAGFFTGVYFVMDLFDQMGLKIQTVAVSIQNFLGDMKVGVLTVLQGMVNGAIDIINWFIDKLNLIPGVSIEAIQKTTFAATASAENEAAKANRNAALEEARQEVEQRTQDRADKLAQMWADRDANHAARQAEIQVKRAAQATGQENQALPSSTPYDELSGQLGDIAGSVGSIEKSVKMSDEDIKSLVDVAERRYVNNVNLTALTPMITVNGANTGRTAADRQSLANAIRDILIEQTASGSTRSTARPASG
ncbi:tape measure protein [Flavonifractor plautii]|jgi:tape measure domain-containing protein|uniref:Tape measure protein n=2 Tax=Flavonifractor plautii TaxID=292800 RepID=A0AAW6C871_FLAPL|nr:tape measure protein [Flavonifractor plautii]MDB7889741.1 tape measure protein [Flavonifractor plautii]MDB7907269.1 tape measure protein [Flavonifractor plautii]DAT76065.1 MAG TPA: Tail tape measure [Caudoviricetes sp.]